MTKLLATSSIVLLTACNFYSQIGYAQSEGNLRPAEIQARESYRSTPINFGANVGYVNVDDLADNVVSFGAFGDYGLSPQFLVGGSLDYWSDTSGVISNNPVEVSSLSAGAHGRWVFTNIEAPFRPFVLAGLAVHRIRVSLSERTGDDRSIDQFSQVYEDIEARMGADIAGGVMYAVDEQIDVIGEIKHRNLFDDKIRFDQWAFSAALSYRL
ncbi:MAG: outer membrane protein [Oligoflexus sp.]